MGNISITWRPNNGFQGQVKELTMITINFLDEEVVQQPVKPSTHKDSGEEKKKNVKFSLIDILRRGRRKPTRLEKSVRLYQDSEWIEDIER
jgi:hypothetical protein